MGRGVVAVLATAVVFGAAAVRPMHAIAACAPALRPAPIVDEAAKRGIALRGEWTVNPSGALRATGTIKGLLLFVDFPDAPARGDPREIGMSEQGATALLGAYSYGKLRLELDVDPTWTDLSNPTAAYATPQPLWEDVIRAADARVDFSRYDWIAVALTRSTGRSESVAFSLLPGFGLMADGRELRFGSVIGTSVEDVALPAIVAHEFLHALGLPDLYGFSRTGAPLTEAVGQWDPMNDPVLERHPLAWHAWLLGWLAPAQLVCVNRRATVTAALAPVASTGGRKAIVVQRSSSTTYVVELRAKVEVDRNICRPGVLVYRIDSLREPYGEPVHVLGGASREDADRRRFCGARYSAPIPVGHQFRNRDIRVRVLRRVGAGYVVRVASR